MARHNFIPHDMKLDETVQRLKAASAEDLDRWAANILTAKTLDEVFRLQ